MAARGITRPFAGVFEPWTYAPLAETDHASRPTGTDRFLLYFHKLDKKRDAVTDPADEHYE